MEGSFDPSFIPMYFRDKYTFDDLYEKLISEPTSLDNIGNIIEYLQDYIFSPLHVYYYDEYDEDDEEAIKKLSEKIIINKQLATEELIRIFDFVTGYIPAFLYPVYLPIIAQCLVVLGKFEDAIDIYQMLLAQLNIAPSDTDSLIYTNDYRIATRIINNICLIYLMLNRKDDAHLLRNQYNFAFKEERKRYLRLIRDNSEFSDSFKQEMDWLLDCFNSHIFYYFSLSLTYRVRNDESSSLGAIWQFCMNEDEDNDNKSDDEEYDEEDDDDEEYDDEEEDDDVYEYSRAFERAKLLGASGYDNFYVDFYAYSDRIILIDPYYDDLEDETEDVIMDGTIIEIPLSDEDYSDENCLDEDYSDEDYSDEDYSDEDYSDEDYSDEDYSYVDQEEQSVENNHTVFYESSSKKELESLIGLDNIKKDVLELYNLIKINETRKKQGLKTVPISLHLVFTGNPGTGKTNIARLLAQLYKEIGVLSKGQLVEVDRAGLVAGYIGQTAIKTQKKIQEAMGGILFIDEAYTLVKEGNDFGQEAIDTLLKAMEDHRDDFIVIVAGYPDLMERFINSNPGLKSRFNKYFYFPDYTENELIEIFCMQCQKYDYQINEQAKEKVRLKIRDLLQEKAENFANAREIRNLFETIITKQAMRVGLMDNPSSTDLTSILSEDIL